VDSCRSFLSLPMVSMVPPDEAVCICQDLFTEVFHDPCRATPTL
jgi:hypothetical protein